MIVDDGEPAVAIPPALQQVVTAYCLDGGDNPNNNSDQLHFAVILQAVAEKEVSLQDLVATTEKFLTSSVDMQRNKATSLLAELLHKAPVELSSPVAHLFVVFFSHRLSDYPSIIPSLHALCALCGVDRFGKNLDSKYYDAVDVYQTIFRDVHVQSYPQNVRQKTFQLVQLLLENEIAVESSLSIADELFLGFNGLIEEEKDPRCLLLMLSNFSKAIAIYGEEIVPGTAEKVFDSVACYFPITFTPPPDDPFGITPEMLIQALEDCLCGHLLIVKHTVPFMVDQMDGEMHAARVNACVILLRIVKTYSHTVLKYEQCEVQHDHDQIHFHSEEQQKALLLNISEKIYELVINDTTDSELVQKTLELVRVICSSMGSAIGGKYLQDWRHFCDKNLKNVLEEVSKNAGGVQTNGAFKFALAVASASYICNCAVADILLPVLLLKVQQTFQAVKNMLERSFTAHVKGFNVLPSLANTDTVVTAPLEYLTLLLKSSLILSTEFSVDYTNFSSINPLRRDLRSLIDTVAVFLDDKKLIRDFRTNPDLANIISVNSVNSFVFDSSIAEALHRSVECMGAILKINSESSTLGSDAVIGEFVEMVTRILMSGPTTIVQTAVNATAVETSLILGTSGFQAEHLYNECFNFILLLSSKNNYEQLVTVHSLQHLFRAVRLDNGFNSTVDLKRIYNVLTKISSGSPQNSIMLQCALVFHSSIMHCLDSLLEKPSTEVSIAMVCDALNTTLEAMADLLPFDPAAAPDSSPKDGDKAKILCGTPISSFSSGDGSVLAAAANKDRPGYATDSPVFTVIYGIVRNLSNLENVLGDGTVLVQILYSLGLLIRRSVAGLDPNVATDLARTLLELTLSNEALHNSALPGKYISAVNHTSVLCVSILTYLDKTSNVFLNSSSSRAVSDCSSFIIDVLNLTVSSRDIKIDLSIAELLAVILNKAEIGATLDNFLVQLLAALDNYAKYCRSLDGEKLSATSGNTKFMIAVFNYSLKALLLRTFVPLSNSSALLQGINLSDFVQLAVQQQVHSSFKNSWQGVLIQYFIVLISSDSSNTFANDLAASLSAVYLEGVVVLSKAARGNCSPFWKQKLWKELVAQLIDNSSISGDGSPNNLKIVAVCAVATCLPLSIMQSSFDQLVTTVITAIASNGDCIGTSVSDSSTIASNSLLLLGQSVQTLEILLSINAKAFVPYLNVIIPATTNLLSQSRAMAKTQRVAISHNSVVIAKHRASAVKCLSILAVSLAYHHLHSFKSQVTKSLGLAVDDPKRVVRVLARKTRNIWLTMKN